jgi:hypothetical protein
MDSKNNFNVPELDVKNLQKSFSELNIKHEQHSANNETVIPTTSLPDARVFSKSQHER